MARLSPGDRINNYLLEERIGAGSFGEVWKARHHVFNESVAIKIPTDPQFVRHLQREGTAIHGLRDPHIVRALDMDPYADPPYLIMEYVDGPSLRGLICQHPQGLPVEAAVAVLYAVLGALDVAHRAGIIHRDIKPENILIGGGGDTARLTPERVKVGDFGLGRIPDADVSMRQSGSISLDAAGRLSGTIAYMSPEQRDGAELDARSDLYAVGLVLFEMLTGVLPQGSELPSAVKPDLPRWLDRVFERCYTRRDKRFASAAEMRSAIEHYAAPAAPSFDVRLDQAARAYGAANQRQCPACEGPVQAHDQFCIHCGRQLVQVIPRCPTCHAFVSRTDKFCILCGTDLRQSA